MWGLSHNLTDKQIQELAAHFAAQKLERSPIEGKPERVAAGKSIFTDGLPTQSIPACSSCHGPDGMGNAAFPRIAGQHVDYLSKQLKVFQRTDQRPEGVVLEDRRPPTDSTEHRDQYQPICRHCRTSSAARAGRLDDRLDGLASAVVGSLAQ